MKWDKEWASFLACGADLFQVQQGSKDEKLHRMHDSSGSEVRAWVLGTLSWRFCCRRYRFSRVGDRTDAVQEKGAGVVDERLTLKF